MPDISMCANTACPMREICYRYRAIPDEYAQTYANFTFQRMHTKTIRKGDKDWCEYDHAVCDSFWDARDYEKSRLVPFADVEALNSKINKRIKNESK